MSGKLTFGYLYDFRNPEQWRKPWSDFYAEVLDIIAWTEEIGFEGAWIPEHHLADDGYVPSPMMVLSAIAARTKRMKLGAGIALAPLYNPMRFAEDCAILDIMSDGRVEMGLGIGYRRAETNAFGVDFTKRGRMFDEWLQITTRLWAGETVDFTGDFYSVQGARLMPPAPRGRIPLFIGGFADKAIARVALYADGYIGDEKISNLYLEKLRAQGKQAGAGRMRVTGLTTVVARDPEKAMEELAPHFLHVNNTYGEWFKEDEALGNASTFEPMSLETFKQSGILQIMTPEDAIAMFRRLQQEMPLDHYMMMLPPGLPTDRFVEYAELFAKEVIPAFA